MKKLTILFFVLLLILSWFYYFDYKKLNKTYTENQILKQSLNTYKDIYERQVATINEIELDKHTLKIEVAKIKDKYNLTFVKPSKVKSITSVKTETAERIITNTIVKYIDSFAQYSSYDSTQWHVIKVLATIDSTFIHYKINNQYITTSANISPWYKSPQYKITTINLNPNTQTKEMINYKLKPKRAKRLIWFGLGLIAGSYIIVN